MGLLLIGWWGCSGDGHDVEPSLEGVSLVELFPLAERDWQVRAIDFGSPEGRRHLVDGWGYDETGRLRDAVWSLGPRSSIRLYLSHPQDPELHFDVRDIGFEGIASQRMTVSVNGQVAGTVDVPGGFGRPVGVRP